MCEREEALDAASLSRTDCQDDTMYDVQGKRSTLRGRAAQMLCQASTSTPFRAHSKGMPLTTPITPHHRL